MTKKYSRNSDAREEVLAGIIVPSLSDSVPGRCVPSGVFVAIHRLVRPMLQPQCLNVEFWGKYRRRTKPIGSPFRGNSSCSLTSDEALPSRLYLKSVSGNSRGDCFPPPAHVFKSSTPRSGIHEDDAVPQVSE